jgi:hypothetical protein
MERRAKTARRSFAFYRPRPPLLRDSTKERVFFFLKSKPSGSGWIATRGSVADAFFGASPVVASALGIRLGATPRGRSQHNSHFPALLRKADISTWQKTGHFHLALTLKNFGATRDS